MSSVDDVIATAGVSATIIRAGGNINTYMYMRPKTSMSIRYPYEFDGMLPTTSGVVGGDLIQYVSNYFLVFNLYEDRRAGEFFYYQCKLFRCNATITIKAYNPTTKVFADSVAGIQCLIADSHSTMMSDRGLAVPGYGGKDDQYYLYAQAGAGINKNSILVDALGNKIRISDNINPYPAPGLVEIPIKFETT